MLHIKGFTCFVAALKDVEHVLVYNQHDHHASIDIIIGNVFLSGKHSRSKWMPTRKINNTNHRHRKAIADDDRQLQASKPSTRMRSRVMADCLEHVYCMFTVTRCNK